MIINSAGICIKNIDHTFKLDIFTITFFSSIKKDTTKENVSISNSIFFIGIDFIEKSFCNLIYLLFDIK